MGELIPAKPKMRLVLLAILAIIPAVFAYNALTEHARRVALLSGNSEISARVTRSYVPGRWSERGGLCNVEYSFPVNGQTYNGGLVSCSVMKSHPVGSEIPVVYDPLRPDNSLARGDSSWPPSWLAAVVLIPCWLLLLFSFGTDFLRNRPRRYQIQ